MTIHPSSFPYIERASEVEAARHTVNRTFELVTRRHDKTDPATSAWLASIDHFNASLDRAYPTGFWELVTAVRKGETAGLDLAIDFLEAGPIFFRSGYAKEKLLRLLKRLPLSPLQAERLRTVVLHIAASRDAREFRAYCHLARRLDSPSFRADLAELMKSLDPNVVRRARWVFDGLDGKPPLIPFWNQFRSFRRRLTR